MIHFHNSCSGGGTSYIHCANHLWWLVRSGEDSPVWLDPILRRSAWNISRLGSTLGMGSRTVTRLIEHSTGLPAKTWLRQVRAVTACHLLREGWKIEALSSELGFRHPASFTREFKSIVGVCPSTYARMERSRFFIPPAREHACRPHE